MHCPVEAAGLVHVPNGEATANLVAEIRDQNIFNFTRSGRQSRIYAFDTSYLLQTQLYEPLNLAIELVS